jgi:hypothetical protein
VLTLPAFALGIFVCGLNVGGALMLMKDGRRPRRELWFDVVTAVGTTVALTYLLHTVCIPR